MANVHFPQCRIQVARPVHQCVSGIIDGRVQTWILFNENCNVLIGTDNYSGLRFGPAVTLYHARTADEDLLTAPRSRFTDTITCLTWDSWSSSIYGACEGSIVRIKGDEVSLIAEVLTESGEWDEDFDSSSALASDGAGALYFALNTGILRKVQLPAALQCSSGTVTDAVSAAGPGDEAVVSSLPFSLSFCIKGLVHMPDSAGGLGSLVYCTYTALYRVQLGSGGDESGPVLLAGREGQEGPVDGRGEEARFACIQGLTVDAEGHIICVNRLPDEANRCSKSAVRCVAHDGTVTTLVGVDGHCDPHILPNGYLLLHSWYSGCLLVLSLGLKPQPLSPPPTATSSKPQPGSLPADWGTLFDRPQATSDLTLIAGDRVFPVHRLVLSVRCEYFRRCLAGGSFAEGSAAQLTLPDTDPDALELVLRFIYTGAVDVPVALACPVAELADRLLLPVLTAAACEQVRMGEAPETVVDRLLWAERCAVRGGGFPQLLAELKTWCLEHYNEVSREAHDSQRRLAAASPDLMFELLHSALSEERASNGSGSFSSVLLP